MSERIYWIEVHTGYEHVCLCHSAKVTDPHAAFRSVRIQRFGCLIGNARGTPFWRCQSSDPAKNQNALNAFLAPLAIADFDARAAELYGDLRTHLERRGTPIGPLDTMIAAHALSLGIPIITNNIGEFSRVPALAVQDWTQP